MGLGPIFWVQPEPKTNGVGMASKSAGAHWKHLSTNFGSLPALRWNWAWVEGTGKGPVMRKSPEDTAAIWSYWSLWHPGDLGPVFMALWKPGTEEATQRGRSHVGPLELVGTCLSWGTGFTGTLMHKKTPGAM